LYKKWPPVYFLVLFYKKVGDGGKAPDTGGKGASRTTNSNTLAKTNTY
jgi:hypothetical protein